MNYARRLSARLAFWLGLFGVVACAASAVVALSTASRLRQVSANAFAELDKTLASIRDRVLSAEQRVQRMQIATDDIEPRVRTWIEVEAGQRLAWGLELEEQTEQLALSLRQVDLWLATSAASMQGVRQLLTMVGGLGVPVDSASVASLLDVLEALQGELQQAATAVDGFRVRIESGRDGQTETEPLRQAAQIVLRLAATLGKLDARLDASADRFAEARIEMQRLETAIRARILALELGALLLAAWMAAGQFSLCRYGRTGFTVERPPDGATSSATSG